MKILQNSTISVSPLTKRFVNCRLLQRVMVSNYFMILVFGCPAFILIPFFNSVAHGTPFITEMLSVAAFFPILLLIIILNAIVAQGVSQLNKAALVLIAVVGLCYGASTLFSLVPSSKDDLFLYGDLFGMPKQVTISADVTLLIICKLILATLYLTGAALAYSGFRLARERDEGWEACRQPKSRTTLEMVSSLSPHYRYVPRAGALILHIFGAVCLGLVIGLPSALPEFVLGFNEKFTVDPQDVLLNPVRVSEQLDELSHIANVWATTAIVAILLAIPTLAFVGQQALERGRNRLRVGLRDLVSKDERPPVLFLRSFSDDHVRIRLEFPHNPVAALYMLGALPPRLENVVLEEGSLIGPVIAIGNPKDEAAPFGAAREYLSDADWKLRVVDYCKKAGAIVVCVDETEGTLWEIRHIFSTRQHPKTLFMLHPRHLASSTQDAILAKVEEIARQEGIECTIDRSGAQHEGILGFWCENSNNYKVVRGEALSDASCTLVIRLFFSYLKPNYMSL